MARYLLIESKDPFEGRSNEGFLDLAGRMAAKGDSVSLFFVQNGVLTLRKESIFNRKIQMLIESRVKILADRFSLAERAIDKEARLDGVLVYEMEQLIDALMEPGMRTIWH